MGQGAAGLVHDARRARTRLTIGVKAFMKTHWSGCGTALVTPFTETGELDESAIRRLAKRQIDGGVHFLVPCGTTGESPTLSHAEKLRVVELVVAEAAGQVPVLGGAGGYDTTAVVALAQDMARAGVDGILSVTPYYSKPSAEGLYRHFCTIAESLDRSVVVYNVPSRTGSNISPETLNRLASVPQHRRCQGGIRRPWSDVSDLS